MSVSILNTDIFASAAHVLVNPVNCVGVMGKGLALEFRQRYPQTVQPYELACQRHELRPGDILPVPLSINPVRYVVHLATKDHWRHPSKLMWVAAGAMKLRSWVEARRIESIACPALGAGAGGLPWESVLEVLQATFEESRCHFEIYAPMPAATTQSEATWQTGAGSGGACRPDQITSLDRSR